MLENMFWHDTRNDDKFALGKVPPVSSRPALCALPGSSISETGIRCIRVWQPAVRPRLASCR